MKMTIVAASLPEAKKLRMCDVRSCPKCAAPKGQSCRGLHCPQNAPAEVKTTASHDDILTYFIGLISVTPSNPPQDFIDAVLDGLTRKEKDQLEAGFSRMLDDDLQTVSEFGRSCWSICNRVDLDRALVEKLRDLAEKHYR